MLSDSETPNEPVPDKAPGASGNELDGFRNWLEHHGTREKTIERKLRLLQTYLEWLKNLPADRHGHQITTETITYPQLMGYIGDLQKQAKANL